MYRSLLLLSISLWIMAGCRPGDQKPISEQEVAISWAEMTLYVLQFTPANSPTYASRTIGYIGLTMYESVVHSDPEYQSLAGQLNELEALPLPDPSLEYDWILSMNAAQASMLKNIYNQTSDSNKMRIDSLEMVFYDHFSEQVSEETAERSVAYGEAVASAIFEWSKTDGGHRGYLRNFEKSIVHPDRPGSWKPPLYAQSFSHHPLHPFWGENRTFLPANTELPLPEMVPYDTTLGSPYYQEFMSVYEADLALTQSQKEVAIWWGDDPDVSFTPPGHSYYLATIALKAERPKLMACAQTYAAVGMAVADAFIKCWEWKYHFFSERPNTFIPRYIDESWESFWPDPPFPAFPSGHAIQAAASTTVLADLFGNEFTFIDSAHVGRERDELRDTDFVERHFTTFWGVAKETADSRFLGGIHTPQDNQVGLDEGRNIAKRVGELKWKH